MEFLHNWMFLVLIYGIANGVRNITKKKALEKSPLMEVLFLYTLLSFILIIPISLYPSPTAVLLAEKSFYGYILIKAFVVFLAWIFAFDSIKQMPVSVYGVVDAARIIFSTLFGIIFIHETMRANQYLGLFLVLAGIILVNLKGEGEEKLIRLKSVFLLLASCILNSASGTMDKALMSTGLLTAGQLQFWFMLFMTLMYLVYILLTRTEVHANTLIKNPIIIFTAIIFVIGDRSLFAANGDPASRVTVMTLIKQSSLLITVVLGKIVYKEKNILYRLICTALVVLGIVISTL